MPTYPERIVCLTEETTETLYLLGEGHRVVGLPVFAFNQRSVADILQMIRVLAGIVGREEKGTTLASQLERGREEIREAARRFPNRPRTFFEEWDSPLRLIYERLASMYPE